MNTRDGLNNSAGLMAITPAFPPLTTPEFSAMLRDIAEASFSQPKNYIIKIEQEIDSFVNMRAFDLADQLALKARKELPETVLNFPLNDSEAQAYIDNATIKFSILAYRAHMLDGTPANACTFLNDTYETALQLNTEIAGLNPDALKIEYAECYRTACDYHGNRESKKHYSPVTKIFALGKAFELLNTIADESAQLPEAEILQKKCALSAALTIEGDRNKESINHISAPFRLKILEAFSELTAERSAKINSGLESAQLLADQVKGPARSQLVPVLGDIVAEVRAITEGPTELLLETKIRAMKANLP